MNVRNSKVMRIPRTENKDNLDIILNDIIMEEVDWFMYIGVNIDGDVYLCLVMDV